MIVLRVCLSVLSPAKTLLPHALLFLLFASRKISRSPILVVQKVSSLFENSVSLFLKSLPSALTVWGILISLEIFVIVEVSVSS